MDILTISQMDLLLIVTAKLSFFRRAPLQAGHGRTLINLVISDFK